MLTRILFPTQLKGSLLQLHNILHSGSVQQDNNKTALKELQLSIEIACSPFLLVFISFWNTWVLCYNYIDNDLKLSFFISN